ncbi:unnamed protein product [marine sediment metagenome]|uniref:DUF3168 domain-containing protein n=1 Tax=marine sediment metagenome TaxID=412755 RepID=X1M3Y0_9ZZZZ
MKLPTLALHGAQVTRIELLTDYVVYDENPQNVPYPYVVMGEITAKDWSDKSADGAEVYSTIHVWSRYHGRKEADEMADALTQALTSSTLALGASFEAALDRLDGYNLIVDMDGKTRHGILRFKYLIEEL